MNSHSLKFTWKVELGQPIENDKNYRLALEWSIVNESTSPNHDGTYSKTYSFRPIHVLIHDELWDTIKAYDPRKNSEKWRSKLKYDWDKWLWGTKYKEFDDAYDAVFRKMYEQYDFLISTI
jgi:hypothetical protein